SSPPNLALTAIGTSAFPDSPAITIAGTPHERPDPE
ncbi:MAG: hypothetical protein ACI82G_002791, partial [Bradymonadia bacterium]